MAANAIGKNAVHSVGGDGQALVLGHGFGNDQRSWRFVTPAFEARHRIVTFDHLGFGASDIAAYDADRHASLDGYAQDLLEILEALDLHDVVYVGQSIGGVIGLLASIAQPQRFAKLVLLGTSPRFINEPPHYVGGFEAHEIEGILDLMERDQLSFARTLAPLAMGEQSPDGLVEEFSQRVQSLDPLVAQRFGRIVFEVDCRKRLAEVTVPALIVQCQRDSIVPRAVGHYLQAHLAGSRLLEIDASGHCPHLSHPQQTIDAIAQALATASG